MTEVTPLFMDISSVYSGDELGLPLRDLLGEGIIGTGDLLVSAGAGNSVNIAAGSCYVVGDTNPTRQPCYRCLNDAVVNKGINPDPANPRRVLVVAQIVDEAFAGLGRLWRIDVIHGTPAAAPVVPALPASAISLANILVPAAAASSAAYTITDTRSRAAVGAGILGSTSCKVRRAAAQSIPNAANTLVSWDEEMFDPGGMWAIGDPTRIYAPRDGIYRVSCHGRFAANITGVRTIEAHSRQPGGATREAYVWWNSLDASLAGGGIVVGGTELTKMFAGDYIETFLFQTAGVALNTDITIPFVLSVELVGSG